MYNPDEIKDFCFKSFCLWLSSNLFMNVMQWPEPDLPYGREPGAPH